MRRAVQERGVKIHRKFFYEMLTYAKNSQVFFGLWKKGKNRVSCRSSVCVYMYLAERITKDPVFIFEKQRIAQGTWRVFIFSQKHAKENRETNAIVTSNGESPRTLFPNYARKYKRNIDLHMDKLEARAWINVSVVLLSPPQKNRVVLETCSPSGVSAFNPCFSFLFFLLFLLFTSIIASFLLCL